MIPRRKFLHLTAGAAALPALTRNTSAQAYPSRPVRIIVPYAPAGGTDILARIVAQWLSERLGQQFIIENRPGANSNIGTEAVVRAQPDGYTLLAIDNAPAINARLNDKLHLRFYSRYCAGRWAGAPTQRVACNPVVSSEDGSGFYRLR
jgi:tripartite-type tricarboxylate transporter receptor subunit TctC